MKKIITIASVLVILGSSLLASISTNAEEVQQVVEVVDNTDVNGTHDTYGEIIETFDESIVADINSTTEVIDTSATEIVDTYYSTEKSGDFIVTTSNTLYSDGYVEQNQIIATAADAPSSPSISQTIGGISNPRVCTNGTYWFSCNKIHAWTSKGSSATNTLVGLQVTCDISAAVGAPTRITNIVLATDINSHTTLLRNYYTIINKKTMPWGETAAYQVGIDVRNIEIGSTTLKAGLKVNGFTVTPLTT